MIYLQPTTPDGTTGPIGARRGSGHGKRLRRLARGVRWLRRISERDAHVESRALAVAAARRSPSLADDRRLGRHVRLGHRGGDPGNACDTQTQSCFGAVAYSYRISKYEVTNAQYAEFLSAKAASDPLGLPMRRTATRPPEVRPTSGATRARPVRAAPSTRAGTPGRGRDDRHLREPCPARRELRQRPEQPQSGDSELRRPVERERLRGLLAEPGPTRVVVFSRP